MKFPTRRAFAALLPSLGLAQQTSQKTPRGEILPTGAFVFEKLRLRQSQNMKTYPILSGTTHSGFNLDLPGIKQISETEAKEKHLGKVRGQIDFSQADEVVLETFSAALKKLQAE